MRPHGRAVVSRSQPEPHAICDRCGFRYLHRQLRWQYEWQGPRLQNTRILVCDPCCDVPQEQLRTVVIPPDPVAIENPRPENYIVADNPISGLGWAASNMALTIPSTLGANFGSMTLYGGVNAAFNGVANKPISQSAALLNSVSSFRNTVIKYWSGDGSGATVTAPTGFGAPTRTFAAASFIMYAPNDAPFLSTGATGFTFDGSNNGATWTTLYSGTTAGTVGETVTSPDLTSQALYAYHRVAIEGDGISPVAIAQLVINSATGSNAEVA